jgi:hypothetical protein
MIKYSQRSMPTVLIQRPQYPPPTTLWDFIQSQDPWLTPLMQHVTYLVPFDEVLTHLTTDEFIWGASDGSVRGSQGTFGWALATETGTKLVEGMGPAFGSSMDSYRAEGFGVLSIMAFLLNTHKFTGVPLAPLQTTSDNKALVETLHCLRHRIRPQFPSDTLAPSWDVLQKITDSFLENPSSISLSWVQSHQDKDKAVSQLPIDVQLNIRADELAGNFHGLSQSHRGDPTQMITGTKCQLLIQGETVSSKHRKTARNVRRTAALHEYMAQKYKWSPDTQACIDWASYSGAINTWNRSHANAKTQRRNTSTFLTKFLHQWLPVGKRVARYNSTFHPQECCSCHHPLEDTIHFLRCPHRRDQHSPFRRELRLKSESLNTDPILMEILLEGLQTWLNSTPISRHRYPEKFQLLLIEQSHIGWDQLFYGRWSAQWKGLQLEYLRANHKPVTRQNQGSQWVSAHIQIIWNHCHQWWQSRNNDRHGAEEAEQQAIRTAQAQRRIRVLYELRDLCRLNSHQGWFYSSPDEHFRREPTTRQLENWLAVHGRVIHTRARTTLHNQRQGLRAIDEAFEQLTLHSQSQLSQSQTE